MPKTYKQLQVVIISLLLIFLGGVVGFKLGRGQNIPLFSSAVAALPSTKLTNTAVPESHKEVDFTEFWDVWNRLEQRYHDTSKFDTRKMVDGAIAGMTSSLGDPYTLYLPISEQKRASDDLNGSFDGVGIQLGYKNNAVVVVAPLKGMPAEAAGIIAGDYVIKVKDKQKGIEKETAGVPIPEVVSMIRGAKGTEVTLTMLREGQEPRDVPLKRDTIVVPSVELTFTENSGKKIAHLKLTQFGGRTNQEWKEAVDKILAENAQGVVLDMRNNPGGYLQEAVSIASEFIPDGLVVTQEGRAEKIPYYSTKKGRLTKVPVVVLINKGSASASEIVAGALRDQRKALLVGENSFGKGTVQDAQELPSGAGLHVTVAKWVLPGGDWIHEKGLKPAVEIKAEERKEGEEPKDVQYDKSVEEIVKLIR